MIFVANGYSILVLALALVVFIAQCHTKRLGCQNASEEAEFNLEDMIPEVKSCQVKSVTLFYDDLRFIDRFFVDWVNKLSKPLVLFNVHNRSLDETKNNLFTFYTDLKQSFFILMVRDPSTIMDLAEQIFNENYRSVAAIMPHKSQWLVFVWNDFQQERMIRQQRFSQMDNVCLVRLRSEDLYGRRGQTILIDDLYERKDHAIQIDGIVTFVWTPDRTKSFHHVEELSHRVDKSCVAFPNKKFGMNGRHLEINAVLYMTYDMFNATEDPDTGTVTYTGFRMDFLKLLAQSLNFTYNITVLLDILNKDPLATLGERTVDMSLIMLSTTATYNQTDVTTPVYYETIRGMYARQSRPLSLSNMSNFLLSPFSPLSYLLLPASLLFCSFLWMAVASVRLGNKGDKDELSNAFPYEVSTNQENDADSVLKGFASRLLRYASIVWILGSTAVNQGETLKTSKMSSRIVLFSWYATMVILYALYTGSLTSGLVNKPEEPPFNTFEDMIASGEFEWGTLRDEGKIVDIFNKSDSSVLNKLASEMIIVDDTKSIAQSRKELVDMLNGRFVFIYYETLISNLLSSGDFVVVKESLLTMNRGLSVPKHSELRTLLSDPVLDMHESGITDHLLAKHNLSLLASRNKSSTGIRLPENKKVGVRDILILFVAVVALFIISWVILFIEVLLSLCPFLYLKNIVQMVHDQAHYR